MSFGMTVPPNWTVFKTAFWNAENIHYRIGMRWVLNPVEFHIPFQIISELIPRFKPAFIRGQQVEDSDRPDFPGPRSTTFQEAERTT